MSGALALDSRARILNGGLTVLGGDPLRILRLTPTGAAALRALLAGQDLAETNAATLARRLTDAGIAHPNPAPCATDDVTVVVPVRDRPDALDRCLAGAGTHRLLVVDDGSSDPAAVATVCARHGAELIRRPVPGGPAVARNAALPFLSTRLVAFLDSDCVPEPGWLERLCGELADPAIAAAAPRIRPLLIGIQRPRAVARFAAARSPLDLGDRPGPVRPGSRIGYVPSAALLVRASALVEGFDPELRYGEDVDLIWRMCDAGHRVRYVPDAVVRHVEPARLISLLVRRFSYGTSAGPLAQRHPDRLAPLIIHPRPTAVVAAAAVGSRRTVTAITALYLLTSVRPLMRAGLDPRTSLRVATRGVADTATAVGRSTTMLATPLLALALTRRRTRRGAACLLLAEPLGSWVRARPDLDPVRWTALAIADDLAYGAGVWTGAARARTLAPLRPGWTGVRGARKRHRSGATSR